MEYLREYYWDLYSTDIDVEWGNAFKLVAGGTSLRINTRAHFV